MQARLRSLPIQFMVYNRLITHRGGEGASKKCFTVAMDVGLLQVYKLNPGLLSKKQNT